MVSSISRKVQAAVARLIEERSQIWHGYDETQKQVSALLGYEGKFGRANAPDTVQSLSDSQLPPDEVAATVWELKQRQNKIETLEKQIASYKDDIKKVENQFTIVVVAAVACFLILIVIIMSSF